MVVVMAITCPYIVYSSVIRNVNIVEVNDVMVFVLYLANVHMAFCPFSHSYQYNLFVYCELTTIKSAVHYKYSITITYMAS